MLRVSRNDMPKSLPLGSSCSSWCPSNLHTQCLISSHGRFGCWAVWLGLPTACLGGDWAILGTVRGFSALFGAATEGRRPGPS